VPLLSNGEPGKIPRKASSAGRHLVLVRYRTLDQGSPHVAPVDNDSEPMTGPISQADMVPGDYVFMNSITTVRSITKQIQLVIARDGFGTVGRL
jgi:hypothetical protein